MQLIIEYLAFKKKMITNDFILCKIDINTHLVLD